MARRAKKTSALAIPDLSKAEGRVTIPEGRYLFEIVEVSKEDGQEHPYLKWTFAIAKGKLEGKKAKPYITSYSPDSLWNLRNLLEAIEIEIPDGDFELEPDDAIGKQFYSEIVHEDYQGRTQSTISGSFEPADGGGKEKDDEEDEDDKKSSKKDKGKKGKDKKKLYTQDDINDMDSDELADVIKETEIEVDLDDFKTLRKQRVAVIDALTEAELIEDDE